MVLRGYPLNIYSNRSIHLPRNLCRVYGFQEKTKLIRRECTGGFFFRPFFQEPLSKGEMLAILRNEILYLPSQWLIQNELKSGKSILYLTATVEGFYMMIHSEFSFDEL